ncbi:NAD-dependent epimerase/dehydratase family protein [Planctomycetota bacterium]
MEILITGGAGFVGASLAFHFREAGKQVTVFDNLFRRGGEHHLARFSQMGITFVHGDTRNPEDLDRLPGRRYDLLLECAAQRSSVYREANPAFEIRSNFLGLMNCLELARREHIPVIFWSTNKVYGGDRVNALPKRETDTRFEWETPPGGTVERGFDPRHGFSHEFDVDGGNHGLYGCAKLCADLMCQEWFHAFGIPIVVNRFSCLAGPGQFGQASLGWLAWFAIAAALDLPVEYFGWKGKQVRDVLFLPDLRRLIELQVENVEAIAGSVLNVGGGRERTLSPIEASHLIGSRFRPLRSITVRDAPRRGDHAIYISDLRPATELLGWKPEVTVEAGCDEIFRWVTDHKAELAQLYGPRHATIAGPVNT